MRRVSRLKAPAYDRHIAANSRDYGIVNSIIAGHDSALFALLSRIQWKYPWAYIDYRWKMRYLVIYKWNFKFHYQQE